MSATKRVENLSLRRPGESAAWPEPSAEWRARRIDLQLALAGLSGDDTGNNAGTAVLEVR
jgi:hypothetical protein